MNKELINDARVGIDRRFEEAQAYIEVLEFTIQRLERRLQPKQPEGSTAPWSKDVEDARTVAASYIANRGVWDCSTGISYSTVETLLDEMTRLADQLAELKK